MTAPSSPAARADAAGRSAVVWLDPGQADLVRAIAASAGLRIVGAGCPQLGRAREVAALFGAAPLDDLRTVVTSHDADVLLIASPGEFGSGAGAAGPRRRMAGAASGLGPIAGAGAGPAAGSVVDDWAVLDERRARGGIVLSLEPMPASVLQLESPSLTPGDQPGSAGVVLGPGGSGLSPGPRPMIAHAGEWAVFVPLFRRGSAMRAAADVLSHLGPIHTVGVEFVSGPGEGSLGARLFDALDTVTSLLGEAETVDASYVWPGRGKIVHPAVGESLRGLAGLLSANLRFPDGRAASLLVGDHAVGCGRWSRRVTLVADAGRISLTDAGFEHYSADGSGVDRSGQRLMASAEAVISEQVRAAIDPHAPATPPTDLTRVLATTGAALLSARTGEAESPETILRMARTA